METSYRQSSTFPGGSLGTIPMCFENEEVSKLRENLKQPNFPLNKNGTNYGYRFCEKAKVIVTDIGLCMTYGGPKVLPGPYAEKNFVFKSRVQTTQNALICLDPLS